MAIDPLALVSKNADISQEGVQIGPYAIIEPGVKIGPRVRIWPHTYICSGTEIGEETQVHMGAVIGHLPQDLAFRGGASFLRIGKRNVIREHATIHRGTEEGSCTIVGDDNYLMVSSHIGHNCEVGNKVIISNGALLAGYVKVEDQAFISGNVVIHQYCRIGRLAMVGGFSGVNKDVPPYMLIRGPSTVRAINLVGLRRAGLSRERIADIKEVFRLLYRSDFNFSQALSEIKMIKPSEEISHLIRFIEDSKRGICHAERFNTASADDSEE